LGIDGGGDVGDGERDFVIVCVAAAAEMSDKMVDFSFCA
jgi:hypothetical protein